jgi:hypothetical protein
MRKVWIALLMIAPCLFAHGGEVSGAILTNFLTPTTTLGTATGDLKGGIGVDVLSTSTGPNGSTIYHNQHHWVTESGDTIFLDPANATAIPTFISGLSAADYTDGIRVIGGTGRFAGASGKITAFGAVFVNQDQQVVQVILRYQGNISFAQQQQ